MEHSPRWGTTGTDTKWETRTKGNENEGGHTGSGPDRSYPELTGVVSERVLTMGENKRSCYIVNILHGFIYMVHNVTVTAIQRD